ncbi:MULTISPECIES: TetR/AcrR family transcriptional regulator C-terminal domain-containing protein [unclassified Streptomyces]|uniref:TetR/AcrR family transcriptional regulator C-terminal domain-containing protein n=1 Tax=unclassified Streptomyces TaxID=2593676 RepID=UPI003423EA90
MESLNPAQIVREAIVLLDTAGIDGLSMRRLGSRLGTTAAALYWHIHSKHDLVLLAVDAVWREIHLPRLSETEWRPAAMTMASSLYTLVVQHPWLMAAMTSHTLDGPGWARYDEHLTAVCRAAGFTGQDAGQAAEATVAFVLGSVVASTDAHRFSFGLQAILDGIEVRLQAGRAPEC